MSNDPTVGVAPVDPVATRAAARTVLGRAGFESGSDIYERARPTYPAEAVDLLAATAGLTPGSQVLDLAAGTGKMTRRLVERGLRCVAAEPSPSMREVFTRRRPGDPLVGATAEQVPLGDATVDAVVVAQAFHWFDPEMALAELAGSCAPGVGWPSSERSGTSPTRWWLNWSRISKWDTMAPYPIGKDFGTDIDRSERFGPVQRTKTPVHPVARPPDLRGPGGLPELRPGAPRTPAAGPARRSRGLRRRPPPAHRHSLRHRPASAVPVSR